MGPFPFSAVARSLAGVAAILLAGCGGGTPPTAAPATVAPVVGDPIDAPPAPDATSPAVDRLRAAVAVVLARPAGTARATLTVQGPGTTIVDESWSAWRDGAWSYRIVATVEGLSPTVAESVVADGVLHLRVDGGPWETVPTERPVGSGPVSLRDPGDVLALLRRATQVTPGPESDVLVATLPSGALTALEEGEGGVEVRLTGSGATEAVAEVRGVITVAGGGPVVAIDASWSAEPPPILAPVG